MKNKDVLAFQGGLNQVSSYAGLRFANAVARNKMRIKHYLQKRDQEIDSGFDMKKYMDAIKLRDEKTTELCEKYCIRKENGKPDFIKNHQGGFSYQFEDKEAFIKMVEEKVKKEADVIQEFESIRQELLNEWNEQDSILDIYTLKEEYLPDTINATQIEGIIWMLPEILEDMEQVISSTKEKKVKISTKD